MDEEWADRALRCIQDEETRYYGTPKYDNILRIYNRGPASKTGRSADGHEAARVYLLSDSTMERMRPDLYGQGNEPEPDFLALTLRDYVDRYYGPARELEKPRSWRTEVHYWKRIKDGIGDTRLGDLDEYVVDAYLTNLKHVSGDPASWNTRREHRNALSACLEWSRRRGHRKKPKPQWFRLNGMPRRKLKDVLTREEAIALLNAATPQLRCIMAIGLGMGLRPNEIIRCRWEDIDWQRRVLYVRGTKTEESEAAVPMLPIGYEEVSRWHEACGRPTTGWMFKPERGGKGTGEHTNVGDNGVPYRKGFASAVRAAGITKPCTPYMLRHTCATWAVEAGTPIQSVAKLLRHTNPRMLEQHFDHTGAVRAPGLAELAPPAFPVAAPPR